MVGGPHGGGGSVGWVLVGVCGIVSLACPARNARCSAVVAVVLLLLPPQIASLSLVFFSC